MNRHITQAWGWLAAGVLAAGLNASYHDGGLQRVHQIADRFEHNTATVVALASGRADQFLAEARLLTARNEAASCPLTRVRSMIEQSPAVLEVMSAREEGQLARFEANRARIETRIAARTSHFRIATAAFTPITVRAVSVPVVCPRISLNIPRVPMIKMPVMPEIHIESSSAGPV
jgi:hypothetical protein